MKITIDMDVFAKNVADDLNLGDNDIEDLKKGRLPYNWTNTIIDRLEYDYDLETLLVDTLTEE